MVDYQAVCPDQMDLGDSGSFLSTVSYLLDSLILVECDELTSSFPLDV